MSLAKVQHNSGHGIGNGSSPSGGTLTSTPTVGNLVLAYVDVNTSLTALTIGSGWELWFKSVNTNLGTQVQLLLARYVQSGDSTALPAFVSAGTSYFAWTVIEVSGVAGNRDADLAFVYAGYQGISATTLTMTTRAANVAGQLAVAGIAQYNGNGSPSVSAGWTLDEATSNFSNYGAYGLATLPLTSIGDPIALTVTYSGTSNPQGCIVAVLTPSATTKLVVRRSIWSFAASGFPGQIESFLKPKAGALQLAIIGWGSGTTAAPAFGPSWQSVKQALNGSNPSLIALARYAGAGEASLLPALCTSGSNFYSVMILEIDGVSGTLAVDLARMEAAYQATGTTQATGSQNTLINDSIAILAAVNYDGTTSLSPTGGWTQVINLFTASYGSFLLGFQEVATSGTAVSSTITESDSSHSSSYFQAVLGGGALSAARSSSFIFG